MTARTGLADTGIASLPVELLLVICEEADRSGLCAFALSNRALNDVATPVLYSRIDLQVFPDIYACIRTLGMAPDKTVMNRDLASYVETISLCDPNISGERLRVHKRKHHCVMERRLTRAVARMRRLRSFICQMGIYQTADTFVLLAGGRLPMVRDIDIDVHLPWPSFREEEEEEAEAAQVARAVKNSGLETLKLRWLNTVLSAPCKAFLCSLLAANRFTLQSLELPYSAADSLRAAWQSIPSFPTLRELEVSPKILSQPAFQDTSSIRCFIVPDRCYLADVRVDRTALPNLEEVTCFPDQLRAFLPRRAEHRRPIKVVNLNQAKYERSRVGGYYYVENWDDVPDWKHTICPAVRRLQYSATPLLRLSLVVDRLYVRRILSLMPVMKDLEYLLMMLKRTPGKKWNRGNDIFAMAQVLPHMLRLHTFLLSDGVAKTFRNDGAPFAFAHDEEYQRRALAVYDEQSSSLRRVAFTSEFEWEKREDGWHAWGHVAPEQPIVSDREDGEDGKNSDDEERGTTVERNISCVCFYSQPEIPSFRLT